MTQKRSPALVIEEWPIALPAEAPILADGGYELSDQPITRLHVHQCLELGGCHEGHGVFMIAGKVRTFEAGDVVLIPSAEPHFACSAPGTSSRWTWIYLDPERLVPPGAIDPAWLDTAGMRGSGFASVFAAATHPDLAQAVFRLAAELEGNAQGRRAMVQTLVMEILLHAHRVRPVDNGTMGKAREVPDFGRLAPALQLLARDYARPLLMGELARRCGLSEPQFRRVFRRTMGCAPLAYQHDLRVRTAAALLRGTTKSVLEIGLESGFESVSSLHRAFRGRLGVTPLDWRRGQTSDPLIPDAGKAPRI